jgi:transposase
MLAIAMVLWYTNGMEKKLFEGLPPLAIEYIKGLEKVVEAQQKLLQTQEEKIEIQAKLINVQEEQIEACTKQLDNQQSQIDRLTEMFKQAQKARFGSSSEKARYILGEGHEQESLFNEAEVCAPEEDGDEPESVVVESYKRKPKRTKEELAKDLPVKKVVVAIPEEERFCDICESGIHPIGQELVRRELSIIPSQAYITETYRETYACDVCEKETDETNIIKPEVPEPVVKRGLASPSSVAHVMYQKFVNAMPFYRQEKDWANYGVTISRATLANWIVYTSTHWLQPLWEKLKELLLTSPVILADETVTQVLKEPGKTPQSQSRMWVYCTGNVARPPPIILFEYQPDRSGENPKAFLKVDRPFYLLTDGYAGYNSIENAINCACWAHMRRYYEEAMPKNAPKDNKARIGLKYCQKLFALEDKFKDLSAEERLEKRLMQSKPILDEYFAWVKSVDALAGSKLSKAIVYAGNQKTPLSAFLLDGQIELSSNRVENAIRPYTVGRKNWLFNDTVHGAKASATAYSIIETARANGINPYKYLLHLFTLLPTVLTKNPLADLTLFFPWADEVQTKCRLAKNELVQLAISGE